MDISNAKFSDRLKLIKPSPTLAMAAKARQLQTAGKKIISLSVGEPDFDTPQNIKDAAINAINSGKTKYTAVDGIIELKQAIVNKFKRENGLEYSTKEISVGSGAKQVLFNCLLAIINKGDEVIIPSPYWVSYPDMVAIAEGEPIIVQSSAENDFKITGNQLESAITPKTKCVIINSPSNPTGAAYTAGELRELAEVLLKHENVFIITDDIYEHIIFDGRQFCTIAQVEPKLRERVMTLNGVSKSYSMTGWRIGYAGGPEWVVEAMSIIQSQSTSNPCSISQYAALEAISGPQEFIEKNRASFERRRNLVVKLLNEASGIVCNNPNGAFYVFPSCEALIGKRTKTGKVISNSEDFVTYLLEEYSVAAVHGSAFGMENFFRVSYATSEELITDACERIKLACDALI